MGLQRGTGLAAEYYLHINRAETRHMWKKNTSDDHGKIAWVDKSFLWLKSRLDSIVDCLFVNMIFIEEKYNCSQYLMEGLISITIPI